MIYLDNSATTLKKPEAVIQAVTTALTQLGNSGRGVHEDSLKSSEVIFQARQSLCQLFNGEQARQIVFTSGATESLNLAIEGLLTGSDHVITTALEHNSVLRPLYRLQKEKGLEVTIIPADKKGTLNYSAAVTLRSPRFIGEQFIEMFQVVIPEIKKIVEEGIADGSIETEYPEEVADVLMMNLNSWIGLHLTVFTEEQLKRKVLFTKKLFDGIGIPIFNEEIMTEAYKMFEYIKKDSK